MSCGDTVSSRHGMSPRTAVPAVGSPDPNPPRCREGPQPMLVLLKASWLVELYVWQLLSKLFCTRSKRGNESVQHSLGALGLLLKDRGAALKRLTCQRLGTKVSASRAINLQGRSLHLPVCAPGSTRLRSVQASSLSTARHPIAHVVPRRHCEAASCSFQLRGAAWPHRIRVMLTGKGKFNSPCNRLHQENLGVITLAAVLQPKEMSEPDIRIMSEPEHLPKYVCRRAASVGCWHAAEKPQTLDY